MKERKYVWRVLFGLLLIVSGVSLLIASVNSDSLLEFFGYEVSSYTFALYEDVQVEGSNARYLYVVDDVAIALFEVGDGLYCVGDSTEVAWRMGTTYLKMYSVGDGNFIPTILGHLFVESNSVRVVAYEAERTLGKGVPELYGTIRDPEVICLDYGNDDISL